MDPRLQLQIPAVFRDIAETNIDQAEKAFDRFLQAARKSVDTMQSANMPEAVHEIPKRSLDLTKKNVKAAFDHARNLVHAKDLQEVVELQTEFLKNQFAAVQEQMKQLGSGMSAASDETKPSGNEDASGVK